MADPTFVSTVIYKLGARFSLEDMGQLPFSLGVEVIPTIIGLFLSRHS